MNYVYLILSIVLCLSVGFTSGQLTSTQTEWFEELEKPSIYPPGYLFGIVWSILYLIMGISLYLITQKTKQLSYYVVFGTQLVLNFFWTIIFFRAQNIVLALVEIVVLWFFIAWTIFLFYKKSKWAAYLLIPYILWVSFATILTLRIFMLN